MAKKSTSFGDREGRQKAEGYETVKTDLPADRFQSSKQVLNPDQLGGASSPVAGNTSGATTAESAAKKLKAKISVKPDVSVETLEGKQVGGVPLEAGTVARSAAGFGGGISTSDDASKIPYQKGNYRPTTRYGKTRSEDLFELDNTVSEQTIFEVEDSLDLKDAPDAKQGYNGRRQFKQTRSKKNSKGRPQSLLFEASNDLNIHNFTIATSGQMVETAGDPKSGYPTRTYGSYTEDGENKVGYHNMDGDDVMPKGNYLLQTFDFEIDNDGHIANPHFVETDYVSDGPAVVRDQANHNKQVDMNNITKAMIKMQTELGRETTEKWSPLGYVIDQPYQYNMLMHDIETTTGALSAIAYRSAVASLAYQRNIISKDGIGPVSSAVRMFLEGSVGVLTDSSIVDGVSIDEGVWNADYYRRGSAAAMIRMFDSVNKYRTKADFLGMQRSLPLHLSQADNNINPLHVKPEFMKVMDKAHLFSTLSGDYNPALPIHVTKKVNVINPLSLNAFLVGWKHPSNPEASGFDVEGRDYETGTLTKYCYAYTDLRNRYTWYVKHPLVEGLLAWMLRHEGSLAATYGKNVKVSLPASFDFTNPSMFQFMICSASQLTALKRNQIFRDVLFAGEQSTYIWDHLVSLKDADPLHSTQLHIGEYNTPLKVGKLAPDTALRLYWSDHISIMQYGSGGTNDVTYSLPWFFNEQAFAKGNGSITYDPIESGFYDDVTPFNMSIPSIRCGVRHEFVDLIKSMSESDIRLAMDRTLNPLLYVDVTAADQTKIAKSARRVTYNDTANVTATFDFAALRYDHESDGRVLQHLVSSNAVGQPGLITEDILFMSPKEVGFIWNSPSSLCPVITKSSLPTGAFKGPEGEGGAFSQDAYISSVYTKDINPGTFASAYFVWAYEPSCELTSSMCTLQESYRVKADANSTGAFRAIDRSAALSQKYFTAISNPRYSAQNEAYTDNIGIVLSCSYEDAGLEEISDTTKVLGSEITNSNVKVTKIKSFARTMWSMLQRACYPVNPFEQAYDTYSSITDPVDPLETCFYFGVCGFLASDYTQAVLERLDTFDQLGLDYTEDVNTKESLIFR